MPEVMVIIQLPEAFIKFVVSMKCRLLYHVLTQNDFLRCKSSPVKKDWGVGAAMFPAIYLSTQGCSEVLRECADLPVQDPLGFSALT